MLFSDVAIGHDVARMKARLRATSPHMPFQYEKTDRCDVAAYRLGSPSERTNSAHSGETRR
jgi:hypothetical protein